MILTYDNYSFKQFRYEDLIYPNTELKLSVRINEKTLDDSLFFPIYDRVIDEVQVGTHLFVDDIIEQ